MTVYVVFLRETPIGVHKWPWMALNEAKERSVDGAKAHVMAYKFAYSMDPDFIDDEEPTNPDFPTSGAV